MSKLYKSTFKIPKAVQELIERNEIRDGVHHSVRNKEFQDSLNYGREGELFVMNMFRQCGWDVDDTAKAQLDHDTKVTKNGKTIRVEVKRQNCVSKENSIYIEMERGHGRPGWFYIYDPDIYVFLDAPKSIMVCVTPAELMRVEDKYMPKMVWTKDGKGIEYLEISWLNCFQIDTNNLKAFDEFMQTVEPQY